MKKLFLRFIGLVLTAVLTLTAIGCTSDKITGSVDKNPAEITRNKIVLDLNVNAKVTSAGKLKKCVKASLKSYNEDGEADTVVSSKTITGLNTTLTYSSLKADTDYKFVVETCDGNNYQIMEKEYRTTLAGENEENPIEISTIEDFENISNDLSAYYVLTNDIDFSKTKDEDGNDVDYEYSTIGNTTNTFEGVFDGAGYTLRNITGFKFTTSTQKVYGLFGVNEGTIKNVIIDGIKNITSEDTNLDSTLQTYKYTDFYMGAVAGQNKGIIKDVEVKNMNFEVRSNKKYTSYTFDIGGIAGRNNRVIRDSKVSGSINVSEIMRKAYIGGAVGYSTKNTALNGTPIIERVSADVVVYSYLSYGANVRMGGFIGESDSSEYIRDCYSTGNVHGVVTCTTAVEDKDYAIGGFAGYISGGEVSRVYSTGNVALETSGFANVQAGILSGAILGYSTVTDSFTTGNLTMEVVKDDYEKFTKEYDTEDGKVTLVKMSANYIAYTYPEITETEYSRLISNVFVSDASTVTYSVKDDTEAILPTSFGPKPTMSFTAETIKTQLHFDDKIWDFTGNYPTLK